MPDAGKYGTVAGRDSLALSRPTFSPYGSPAAGFAGFSRTQIGLYSIKSLI